MHYDDTYIQYRSNVDDYIVDDEIIIHYSARQEIIYIFIQKIKYTKRQKRINKIYKILSFRVLPVENRFVSK